MNAGFQTAMLQRTSHGRAYPHQAGSIGGSLVFSEKAKDAVWQKVMARIKLTVCPNCYSKQLKKVRRTVSGTRQGKRYSVPGVEFYECPDCCEQVYDPAAMRQIEQSSRVSGRNRPAKRIA